MSKPFFIALVTNNIFDENKGTTIIYKLLLFNVINISVNRSLLLYSMIFLFEEPTPMII